MSDEQNKAIVRRYSDEFVNQKNLDLADAIFADNFTLHDPLIPMPVYGRERFREMLAELIKSFPDFHYTSEEEVWQGDKVVIRWTFRGTHQGEFLSVAPTGKSVTMSGIDLLYLANGRIERLRVEANLLSLMQQLGALPVGISC